MNTKTLISLSFVRRNLISAGRLAVLLALAGNAAEASDITWTENAITNASPLPTQWLQTNNWDALVVPTNTDNAIFGSAGTNASVTIQMATAKSFQPVGSITLSSADVLSRTIYNNSASTNGILALYGVNGTLLQNSSSAASLIFELSTATKPIILGLAASGQIAVDNANATISSYSVISDYGGSHGFIKTGLGTLYLRATNNYTGPTTNAAGAIQVDATGTLGSSSATVYLTGGNLICAADRSSGVPIANPIVMSADTFVENLTGLANTSRTLPLSGSLSGSGNTLTIANLTSVTGQNFILRLLGGFNFGENIVIGSGVDTPGSYSILQLYNPATNGVQIFTGTISSSSPTSGSGSVIRTGSTTSAAGTSIFTGNNTYSGGTAVSYGTLLADNTAGSAFGSGQVTVTNQGVIGGNGSIVAVTHLGVESPGGTVVPGATVTNIGNLNISDLTFGSGVTYIWKISAAAANPGVNQDLITCSTQWTDAGNSTSPITIQISSLGAVPTGWNSSSSYDWTILQSSAANSFNASHFTINASGFAGAVVGGFGLYVDGGGSLHLTYTPGYNLVINVPSGSQTQEAAGYSLLSGATNVVKVGNGELVLDDSLNSYSGLTTVLAGTVSLAVDALSGSGSLGANSSTTVLGNTSGTSNAMLNINVAGVNDAHSIQVQAGSSGVKTIGTTLTSGTANYQSSIALGDNATLTAAPGGTANFSGNISGVGGLTLSGGGTIALSGLGSYSGTTTAGGVTLDLNGKALGTNVFNINSGVTLDNTGAASVTLNSAPQNWNADFAFTGTTNLNLGGGAVTITNNRTLTVNSNVLSVGGQISGAGGLTKLGAGTLALGAATTNAYTGGTTNAAGVIEINGTATFGNGTGPLVLSGGNIYNDASRLGSPIVNPVLLTTNVRIFGKGTLTGTSEYRYFPFTGPFTVSPGATLYVDNLGVVSNYFDVRLQSTNGSTNFANINFPIIVGDPTFDTAGSYQVLDLANDASTPTQFVNSVISGSGFVERSQVPSGTLNNGGTTVFNQQNTFSGGVVFDSGSIGFGTNSISSGGTVLAGPVGTGTFTIGNQSGEVAYRLFASGGPQTIDNPIYLNGSSNIMVIGSYNLTFTGPVNMGGINKNWDIESSGSMTLSGAITNSANGTGGLSKNGPGTLIFSGNNLYVGATTVRAGTLLVNNSAGSGTSTNIVNVLGGTLGGTGTIAGPVVATNGASVAPGASVGTLTLQNGLDLSSGGALVWTLGANSTSNPGTDFSQLALTGGTLNLGGSSVLSLAFTNAAAAPNATNAFWLTGHTWKIISVGGTAANPAATKFAAIANGVYSCGSFSNYVDASGNVLLTYSAGSPFYALFDSGAGFFSGENLILTNVSGATIYVWSSSNPTLAISNWSLEGQMSELPLGTSGTSRYGINVVPPVSPMYYIAGVSTGLPYLSPIPVTIITGNSSGYTVVGTNVAISAGGVLALAGGTTPRPVISPQILNAGVGNAVISWSSVSGTGYTLQYKTNLTQAAWQTVGSTNAVGTTASLTDTSGAHSQRFYRVTSP